MRRKILKPIYKFLCIGLSLILAMPLSTPVQAQTVWPLPVPGTIVTTSAVFNPAMMMGLTIHPEDPFLFDFIVHPGDGNLKGKAFNKESLKLIKYFMAALTTPEDQMWVNLSPYEKNRIIPKEFGQTEMGRDLLAQDYMLKQLTASLMNPDDKLGDKFWQKIREQAYEKYGTKDIPTNVFNKVWIVPEKAVVHQNGASVFVVESYLKVMLETDYFAMQKDARRSSLVVHSNNRASSIEHQASESESLIRKIIIPAIEHEINTGKTFANLRQIAHSSILAAWYKQNIQKNILRQIYIDKGKTDGIDIQDKEVTQKIYNQYVAAFKNGVHNFIKEEYDPQTQQITPQKYFSGGVNLDYASLNKQQATDSATLYTKLQKASIVAVYLKNFLQKKKSESTPAQSFSIRQNTNRKTILHNLNLWIQTHGQNLIWNTDTKNPINAAIRVDNNLLHYANAIRTDIVPDKSWAQNTREEYRLDYLTTPKKQKRYFQDNFSPQPGAFGSINIWIKTINIHTPTGKEHKINTLVIEDIQQRIGYSDIPQRKRQILDLWRDAAIRIVQDFSKQNKILLIVPQNPTEHFQTQYERNYIAPFSEVDSHGRQRLNWRGQLTIKHALAHDKTHHFITPNSLVKLDGIEYSLDQLEFTSYDFASISKPKNEGKSLEEAVNDNAPLKKTAAQNRTSRTPENFKNPLLAKAIRDYRIKIASLNAKPFDNLFTGFTASIHTPENGIDNTFTQKLINASMMDLKFGKGLIYHGSEDVYSVISSGFTEPGMHLTRAGLMAWRREESNILNNGIDKRGIIVIDTDIFNKHFRAGNADLDLTGRGPDSDLIDPEPTFQISISLSAIKEIWITKESFDAYTKLAQTSNNDNIRNNLNLLFEQEKLKVIPGLRTSTVEADEYIQNYIFQRNLLKDIPGFQIIPSQFKESKASKKTFTVTSESNNTRFGFKKRPDGTYYMNIIQMNEDQFTFLFDESERMTELITPSGKKQKYIYNDKRYGLIIIQENKQGEEIYRENHFDSASMDQGKSLEETINDTASLSIVSTNWETDFPYRPRLLSHDRTELKKESIQKLIDNKLIDSQELGFFRQIEQQKFVTETDVPFELSHILAQLIENGLIYKNSNNILIPVYWVESTEDEIPLNRRAKMLKAFRGKTLLYDQTGLKSHKDSDLVIEYFDERGDNRRVMLVSLDDTQPFVFKYTHKHRKAIAEQFALMSKVINFQKIQKEQQSFYDKLANKYGVKNSPVVKPGGYLKVENTELFTEEYVDGPTRGDLMNILVNQKGLKREAVTRELVRFEGRGLAQIWQANEKYNRGLVLHDLTKRNVKFTKLENGNIIAKYFDFEITSMTHQWSALRHYMNNLELPFLNHAFFVLGWAEGLGKIDFFHFLRVISFDDDLLGILTLLTQAIAQAESLGESITFYFPEEVDKHPENLQKNKLKYWAEYILHILTNTRLNQDVLENLDEIQTALLEKITKIYYSDETREKAKRLTDQLGSIIYQAMTDPDITLQAFAENLLNLRNSGIESNFVRSYYDLAALQIPSDLGGINLNPSIYDIETRGESSEFDFTFEDPAVINADITGLVPVIINVTPVTNIPLLIGVKEEAKEELLSLAQ